MPGVLSPVLEPAWDTQGLDSGARTPYRVDRYFPMLSWHRPSPFGLSRWDGSLRGPHPVTAYSRSPPHVVFLAKPGSGRTFAPPAWNATIVASHGRLHPPQLFRQSLDAVGLVVVVGVRPRFWRHPVRESRLLRMFLPCRFGYPRRPTRGTALRLVVPLGPAFFLGTSPPVVVGDHVLRSRSRTRWRRDVGQVPRREADHHLVFPGQPPEGRLHR